MSEFFLFMIGTIVTLIVGSAVGLLFYGASQEPSGDEAVRVDVVPDRSRATEFESPGPSFESRRYARAWTRSF